MENSFRSERSIFLPQAFPSTKFRICHPVCKRRKPRLCFLASSCLMPFLALRMSSRAHPPTCTIFHQANHRGASSAVAAAKARGGSPSTRQRSGCRSSLCILKFMNFPLSNFHGLSEMSNSDAPPLSLRPSHWPPAAVQNDPEEPFPPNSFCVHKRSDHSAPPTSFS